VSLPETSNTIALLIGHKGRLCLHHADRLEQHRLQDVLCQVSKDYACPTWPIKTPLAFVMSCLRHQLTYLSASWDIVIAGLIVSCDI
jgi:hypothetical protein